MPKDYQEVELVQQIIDNEVSMSTYDYQSWLLETLTTYGNAREREGVEKFKKEFVYIAKLTENQIEDNGQQIDASYYQIYKGEFDGILK